MSRDDGFAVMDVSTSIVDDPKFRKLYRHAPAHAGDAFAAYISTIAESWKAGRRVNVDDAWPVFLPFNKAAIEALIHVELLDADGMVPAKSWRSWFSPARKRRDQARERWKRYNAKRTGDTTVVPRGNDAATATSVRPSVRSDPSVPPVLRPMRASRAVLETRDALKAKADA